MALLGGASAAPLSGGGSRRVLHAPASRCEDMLEAAERDLILRSLEHHKGNATHAARDLGLERSHFYKKMRSLGVRRPGADDSSEGDDE
jgi:DNA-binding NtrC family response regulator